MGEPSVLRACEVTGQEEVGGPMVRCTRPGLLVIVPGGRRFNLCEHHLEVFEADVAPIAHNDGEVSS
jgi:hypothetical protein